MNWRLSLAAVFLWLAGSSAWAQMVGGNVYGDSKSVTCSQATNFIARTSGMDATHQTAFKLLICHLVTQGVWAKLDVAYVFATNSSTNALLNLVSSSYAGTANGSPTFTANAGYTGVDVSTTVYIDTGFNASTAGGNYAQNSGHLSAWSNTNTTGGASGGAVIGMAGAANVPQSTLIPLFSDGNSYYRLNQSSTTGTSVANANSTGHYVATRSGASAALGYKNATQVLSDADASSALVNFNTYVLAFNSNGTAAFGSAIQVMSATIGSNLTSGDVTNLCHELNTYLNTIAGVSSGIC